jgi:hypothetical protein
MKVARARGIAVTINVNKIGIFQNILNALVGDAFL